MISSGENIGVSIVLNQALPTGIDLYAVVSEAFRRHCMTFSTKDNTIEVTNADWKHFAFIIPPAVSVGMNGPYVIELKLRDADGTFVNIGDSQVRFSVMYSVAGHRDIIPSRALPTYTNSYPRPATVNVPTSAEVTVGGEGFEVNDGGTSAVTATVTFSQWAIVGKTLATQLPSDGVLDPTKVYDLSDLLTGNVTISLPSGITALDTFEIWFKTGSIPPSVTWPTGLVWGGNHTPQANKYCGAMMQGNGVAEYREYAIPS